MAGHSGVLNRVTHVNADGPYTVCQALHQQIFSHDRDALVLCLLPFPAPTEVLVHVYRTTVECLTTSAPSGWTRPPTASVLIAPKRRRLGALDSYHYDVRIDLSIK